MSDKHSLEEGREFTPRFNEDGLIPAIVTDFVAGGVLMFAWMNAEAFSKTVETQTAHFWSRSRKKLWKKGEDSGNVLEVVEMRTDCDQDVLWLRARVLGDGLACHTKRHTCFYRILNLDDGGASLRLVSE